jgi:FixJ family two-component response regulator
VLVTDVVMPGKSGHQLARELRRDRADLGVVFITGYDPEGVEIEGAVLLRKPFTRAQRIEALDAVAPAKVANGGPG